MSTEQDSTQWGFFSISGPYLCLKCGLPFAEGDRLVFYCRGEKERPTLDALSSEGGEVVCDADSLSMRKSMELDLVHETCP